MRVEFNSADNTVTVGDVRISLELLACLGDPDPTVLYRIVKRPNGVVTVCIEGSHEDHPHRR